MSNAERRLKKWKFVIGLVFCSISILLLDTSYLILITYFSTIAFKSAGEYPTDFKVLWSPSRKTKYKSPSFS